MNIKIDSIPSCLPSWFDPDAPDFKPPKDWTGSRVRVTVPIKTDPVTELREARTQLEVKYPGADLHLIPDFVKQTGTADPIKLANNDEDLLKQYFENIELPANITSDQVIAYLKPYLPAVSLFGIQSFRFISVEAENVLCFEEVKWEFDVKGLTLITGVNLDWDSKSNGSGKSSLCSLPFIGLFGKTFKDQSHDEWASQNTEKKAFVRLHLELSDKRKLDIYRQRRPGLLQVHLDGREISMGKPDQTQKLIESLTNLTWEVLSNALYIGQSEIGSVFGTEKQRKELFSQLLGLNRFTIVQKQLREVASRISKSAEVIKEDLIHNEASVVEVEKSLSLAREKLKQAPKVSKSLVSKIEKNIRILNTRYDKHLKQIQQFKENINTYIMHTREAWGAICKAESVTNSFSKIQNLAKKNKARCESCGTNLKPENLKKYIDELEDLIFASKKYQLVLRANYDDFEKLKSEQCEKREAGERELSQIENKRARYKYRLQEIQQQKSDRDKLRNELIYSKDRLQELQRTKEIHSRAYTSTVEERLFLDACVNAVSRNGLPAYLCAVTAPQLNKSAGHYSEVFSDSEINIEFVMSEGDIDISIQNLHGGKKVKDQSAGEMRMAGIISAFTFRDVLVPLNILICDEPSEGFDTSNSVAFAKGLMQVKDRFDHIVVISHNSSLVGTLEPDRHIEVVKSNGVSSIISK